MSSIPVSIVPVTIRKLEVIVGLVACNQCDGCTNGSYDATSRCTGMVLRSNPSKVIIFHSRHAASKEQIDSWYDAEAIVYWNKDAAGMSIETENDVSASFMQLLGLVRDAKIGQKRNPEKYGWNYSIEVHGVFASPILEHIADHTAHCASNDSGGVLCLSSWNVQRSVEGGKPTFHHKKWCRIGVLSV